MHFSFPIMAQCILYNLAYTFVFSVCFQTLLPLLSFVSAWESKNKDLISSSSTMLFTSDALKTYRRGQRMTSSNDPLNPPQKQKRTPPEVAPKPKGHHLRRTTFGASEAGPATSAGMMAAKSTPSLHNILNNNNNGGGGSGSTGVGPSRLDNAAASPPGGGRCWKNSLDSLDTESTVSSSSPRHHVPGSNSNSALQLNHSFSSSASGHSASLHLRHNSDLVEDVCLEEREARDSVAGMHAKAKTLPAGASSSAAANGSNTHAHSQSDSGLSSLSGRTSTISPVSTMSVSSGGSNGNAAATSSSSSSSTSGGSSSRASLRSSSIVSQCDEKLIPEVAKAASASSHHPAASTSCPASASAARFKFQEEIECEELSRDFVSRLPNPDDRLQDLFGE